MPVSSPPRKILSIHWGFSPGGISRYAKSLETAGRIASVSLESVVLLAPRWHVDQVSLEGMNAQLLQVRSRFDLSWVLRLRKLILRRKPDLLLAHGHNGHFIVWLLRKISFISTPVACTYHGPYHPPSASRKPFAWLFNRFSFWFLARHANAIAVVAEHCRKTLVEGGIPPGKITVIHNALPSVPPVSKMAAESVRHEWNVGGKDILIGALGRLDPIKGHATLVHALRILVPVCPSLKLVLIGVGEEGDALKRLAIELGLQERVIFAGYRADSHVCLNALDIFVLPSFSETHSLALLEAMRASKPIVATSVGGNVETITHQKEGLLVPPGDPTALADALERLIVDPALREGFARSSRERFDAQFTENSMLRATAQWLSELTGRQ